MMKDMDVSVVGTGRMGSALVKRLSSVGYRVYAWNRSVERLRGLPAEALKSLKDVKGDAVAILVSDDPAVEFLMENGLLDADLTGKTTLLMGTYTPWCVAGVYRRLRERGSYVLCSPILSNPTTLEAGKAYCIVGGDAEGYERVKELYSSVGSSTYLGDSVEEAAAAKLAFNGLLLSFAALLGEATGLARSYGVGPDKFTAILENTMFKELGKRLITKMTTVKEATFTLELAKKDLTYAVQAAEQTNTPTQILSASKTLYELLTRIGMGGEDYSKAGAYESRLIDRYD